MESIEALVPPGENANDALALWLNGHNDLKIVKIERTSPTVWTVSYE